MVLPTVADAIQVRYRAVLLNGSTPIEEAQFGFHGVRHHFVPNVTDWPDDVATLATKFRDAWNTHVTGVEYWCSTVKMDSVVVSHLDAANGKVLDQGQATFDGDDAWVGTASFSLPWETALVVSLYGYGGGFTPDKRRKRGRMYLPPLATSACQTTQGQITQSIVLDIASQMEAFFNEVQGAEMGTTVPPATDSDYFDLRVISRGTPAKPLTPTSTQLIRLVVDSKVDSQRRRERSQDAIWAGTGTIAHSDGP